MGDQVPIIGGSGAKIGGQVPILGGYAAACLGSFGVGRLRLEQVLFRRALLRRHPGAFRV